ncbi:InlB B-repeat-containing protein [Candidatus Saccharibacteria bacterium]|nr:InlB B-repeat-containing protein [Candidatus Saccharibacteria bacterium]
MSSRLLVNLIDPSEIVVPDTDGVPDAGAPDTGILSIGKWLDEAFNNNTALFIAIGLIVLVVAAIIVLLIRRRKKQSSINGFGGYAPMKLGAQKYLVPKLAGLSFVVLVSVFGILKFYDGQRMVNAEAADGSTLTVTTEEVTAIDIEMTDEAAFGVGESKVKVTTATDTGYTLMAYVDSTTTDLTNDSGDKIAMLETSQSQALTDNTWGISLSKPDSQDKTLFRGLPTAEKDAMVVKVSGSDATEANDETTLYYAAYVTPDLDHGTYEGVTINYVAVAHVIDEDVTVNFHGNGYYFDQAGTKDVNTVVYGTSCELAYVGGNCSKVYTTEEPAEIVKTPNIRDDGTQNGPYEIPTQVKVGMASIPGADYLIVELTYNLNGQVVVAQGNENLVGEPAVYEMFSGQGEVTYSIEGDTASFGMFANSPGDGYDYGFYAKVYPVFYQKPENIETIESTSCHFAKSDNLDDEGNMIEPYGPIKHAQSVTLPGANKIKIEIEYALTDEAWIRIFEGQINSNSGPIMIMTSPVYEISTWDMDSDTGSNISGRETIIVDGDSLTFAMRVYDPPVSGYNYGFYARLYPIYDGEQEGTIPEQVCSFTNKSGEYSLPIGYGDDGLIPLDGNWYYVIDDDGYFTVGTRFYDESDVKNEITHYYDELPSKTIDLYLFNNYGILYDSNDGNGNTDDQWVLPHTNANIYSNEFTNAGYEFIGWNTRSDGTGTWYQPDDVVLDLAQPGETITLYAQWEIDMGCNPEATTINNAVCMQDFAGPNSDQIISSMVLNVQYTLIDTRDNKTYTVAKLADGNVWMTQNLDHDIVTTAGFYTYANTDIGHGSTPNTSATWTAERATYVTSNTNWYDVDDSYSDPESYDPGDLCWNGTIRSDYNGTITTDTVACGSDKHYHIGNYYNWTAAVAMNDSSSYTTDQQDVDQSICPAGWRLPTYSGDKSYANLATTLSLTFGTSGNVQNTPVYFVYGGNWVGESYYVGGLGSYWSSVVDDGDLAYGFYFRRDGFMGPRVGGHRGGGDSVRCVAR